MTISSDLLLSADLSTRISAALAEDTRGVTTATVIKSFFNMIIPCLLFWHRCRKRKVFGGVKRWIDVNEIDLGRELRQERRQHVFLLAPDQPIAPLLLAKSGPKLQTALRVLC